MCSKAGRHSWLVIGHGSVGSLLAARFAARGDCVFVCDPRPRVPLRVGQRLDGRNNGGISVDCLASCVSPSAVEEVPALARSFIGPDSLYFDWNSVAPAAKQRVAGALPCPVVDVALLDSIDTLSPGGDGRSTDRPRLAISGPQVELARGLLEAYGFDAEIAGGEVGAAALLKYTRSIFMKSLEALLLEYLVIAQPIDRDGIVWRSLQRNLGARFTRFMDFLLTTNRVHADRRAAELADAVEVFADIGRDPKIALAAVEVLSHTAALWNDGDAPPDGASARVLADYLSRRA
jgi:3-hydroxyisobutyrate dehydrogenase-like beta-hydroxyacid dehydrogenase